MKKGKLFKIVILILCVTILVAGGYVGNMFGVYKEGNYGKYTLGKTEVIKDSPIKGKTIVFLGSSITFGYGSLGVSFVDFLKKSDGIIAVKEAVSGTTLADLKSSSYVARLKTIDKSIKADAFVCQLSTNDASKEVALGEVTDSFDITGFDTKTVSGAIEYIIAYARETWDCPVIFYTQSKFESEQYEKMVELLKIIEKKWGITVIDFWNDETVNSISDAERQLFLTDSIHPTKAGYREWWLPTIRETLYNTIGN